MNFALRTETGKRALNEDRGHIPSAQDMLPFIALSDGMGGHAAGEIASRMTIDGMVRFLKQSTEDAVSALQNGAKRVNFEVFRAAQDNASLRGMGATLVCALLASDNYVVANIGDSRLYHFDGEQLVQVTVDHSLVQVLLEKGSITPEELKTHPRRNVITRAVGVGLSVEADIFERAWKQGDMLLLCSDGLSGVLDEEQIVGLLKLHAPLENIAEKLIAAALEAESTDNITVILARNGQGGNA